MSSKGRYVFILIYFKRYGVYIACEMYQVWILRRFHAFIEMFWILSQMFCCFSVIIYNILKVHLAKKIKIISWLYFIFQTSKTNG